jgi:hypothetical protein
MALVLMASFSRNGNVQMKPVPCSWLSLVVAFLF